MQTGDPIMHPASGWVYVTRRGTGARADYRIGYAPPAAGMPFPPEGASPPGARASSAPPGGPPPCTVPPFITPPAPPGMRVVYLRAFDDPLDALGHKLLLEQLSNDSLLRLIRKFNRNHNP